MSPIVDIQRRFRELGRIRLGIKQDTGRVYAKGPRKGQPIERPVKLPRFRLTSPWGHLIEQAATVFGGEARQWLNDGAVEFEVITELVDDHDVAYLPVVIPPGEVFDQWYELWAGGGLVRRCDGERQVLVDRPCSCPKDPLERQAAAADGKACKPTTRLRLMLPDVADIGIWRLETHGFHAAAELGGAAGLVEAATRQGAMIPAELRLQAREGSRRPGETRKKFFVPAIAFRGTLGPVLDALGILEAGSEMPVLLGVERRPALNAGGAAELPPAGTVFDPRPTEAASFPGPPPEPAPAGPDVVDVIDVEEVPDVVEAFEPPTEAERAPAPPEDGVPEPEPLEPPPAAEPERVYTGPQIIAMKLQDLGVVDRGGRLRLVGSIIGRTIQSSKDLTTKEIRTVLDRLNVEGYRPDPELVTTPPAAPATGEGPDAGQRPVRRRRAAPPGEEPFEDAPRTTPPPPAPPPAPPSRPRPDQWTGDDWRAYLADRGVKAMELLKEAAKLAREQDQRAPGTLDDVAGSGIADLLVGFVEDLALERSGA